MSDPASQFLRDLSSLLVHCQRRNEEGTFTVDDFESCRRKLEYYLSLLEFLASNSNSSEHIRELLEETRPWLRWLDSLPVSRSICCSTPASLSAPQVRTNQQGRPAFEITMDSLEFLRDAGFKWTEIARMLGVSESTITRRVRDYGIQTSNIRNLVSDDELERLISEIHTSHVDAGCRLVRGMLRSRGVIVPISRVHEMLRRIDPISSAQRWGAVVRRRRYRVKGANSLWHIDSHHSLIRWRLIVHGGIDGYSRMITQLQCKNNNKALTALSVFMKGVEKYGIPSRVRGDKGSENRSIAEFMIQNRGTERGSFIAGPSTHNQRIERLWRDVFRVVSKMFYSFFYWLEDTGNLDPENELHIYALHYVFLPRINASLQRFENGWNEHAMRTERNWSPRQMFVNSRLQLGDDIEDLLDNYDLYGRDWEGPVVEEEESVVDVNDTRNPLNDQDYSDLVLLIPDPAVECEDFGLSLFISCKNFVSERCSDYDSP